MTSKTIYAILSSKPHNQHYLKRYLTFIDSCKKSPPDNIYTENHHICPKAEDLFPEYEDIKIFHWNQIKLTSRQHFIAHWILWKAYKGSQTFAFYAMCNGQKQKYQEERTSTLKSSKIYTDLRKDLREFYKRQFSGHVIAIDSFNQKVRISSDEFKSRKDLKGNRKGKLVLRNIQTGEKIDIEVSEKEKYINSGWVSTNCRGLYHTPIGIFQQQFMTEERK